MNTALHHIRSLAIAKANTLQRAHRHFEALRPAFAEWAAGEVYVCRKTGSYRYRFGDASKSVTPWDAIAREVFTSPAAFALAALVFVEVKPVTKPAPVKPAGNGRVNVIALAA